MTFYVYGLVETRSGHRFRGRVRYVGQTSNLSGRVSGYRKGRGSNFHLTNWLKACPNFEVVVLQQVGTRSEACAAEISWVSLKQTYKTPHGLNALPGGGGLPPGPRYAWRGHKKSAAHVAAMSAARKGIPQTPASNAKRSATQKGQPHTAAHNEAVRLAVLSSPIAQAQIKALATGPRTDEWKRSMSKTQSSKSWQCDECGRRSNAGGIGIHQKGSGHVGRSRVTSS